MIYKWLLRAFYVVACIGLLAIGYLLLRFVLFCVVEQPSLLEMANWWGLWPFAGWFLTLSAIDGSKFRSNGGRDRDRPDARPDLGADRTAVGQLLTADYSRTRQQHIWLFKLLLRTYPLWGKSLLRPVVWALAAVAIGALGLAVLTALVILLCWF